MRIKVEVGYRRYVSHFHRTFRLNVLTDCDRDSSCDYSLRRSVLTWTFIPDSGMAVNGYDT